MANALKNQLTDLLARLGTLYSQERGVPGVLFETDAGTLRQAVPACLGAEHTIFSDKLLDDLKLSGEGSPDHAEFMQLVEPGLENGNIEYAAVGEPDLFEPENQFEPGGFYFCFLFTFTNTRDKNLLVAFKCGRS